MTRILILGPTGIHAFERFVRSCLTNGWTPHVILKRGFDFDLSSTSPVQVTHIETFEDIDTVEQIARSGQYEAIVPAYEGTVPAAEYLARKLGLPCNVPADLEVFRNKELMRAVFAQHDVPQPRIHCILSSLEEARVFDWQTTRFPVIAKPVDGVASFHVRRCDSSNELIHHLPAIFSHKRAQATGITSACKAVVEELVEGPEFSVECIIENGRLVATFPIEKFVSDYPYCDEVGHLCSSELDLNMEAINDHVGKIAKAWSINSSVLHVEFKITPSGEFRLIEAANRVAGDRISALIEHHTGWALEEALIRLRARQSVGGARRSAIDEGKRSSEAVGVKFFFKGEDCPVTPPGVSILDKQLISHGAASPHANRTNLLNRSGFCVFKATTRAVARDYLLR